MTADQALLGALADLGAALRQLRTPAMIIGGVAVIARGVARLTVDIDAAVWAEGLDIDRLLAVLETHHIVARIPDARAFALTRQVLLLRHAPTNTSLEVSLAWLPFERDALDRATTVNFGSVSMPVATPEDLIVYKAVAWRQRDRTDIERLLVLHGRDVNLDRIRRLVSEFAEVLNEPERVAEFEALLRRALEPSP